MDAAPQAPDDAVVVFRAVRARDLSAARDAVQDRGIPAVTDWRPTAVPRGASHDGALAEGEGELRVPRRCLEVARQALAAHEDAAQARIRAHMQGLPRDLARVGLLVAAVLLATLCLVGGAPAWALGSLAGAVLVLGLVELAARARGRERGRAATAPPPEPPGPRQRWFDTDAGPKAKR